MCGSYSNNSERSYTYKVYWYIALCTIIVAVVLMECYYWVAHGSNKLCVYFFHCLEKIFWSQTFFKLFPNVFVQAPRYFTFKKSVFYTS